MPHRSGRNESTQAPRPQDGAGRRAPAVRVHHDRGTEVGRHGDSRHREGDVSTDSPGHARRQDHRGGAADGKRAVQGSVCGSQGDLHLPAVCGAAEPPVTLRLHARGAHDDGEGHHRAQGQAPRGGRDEAAEPGASVQGPGHVPLRPSRLQGRPKRRFQQRGLGCRPQHEFAQGQGGRQGRHAHRGEVCGRSVAHADSGALRHLWGAHERGLARKGRGALREPQRGGGRDARGQALQRQEQLHQGAGSLCRHAPQGGWRLQQPARGGRERFSKGPEPRGTLRQVQCERRRVHRRGDPGALQADGGGQERHGFPPRPSGVVDRAGRTR
mmetsp:Transcript_944/g.2299  ORF Transcript_944/g.2299 Transcript_944/m.2299 type:complete len:327 (-) Transcript_944:622-1602(-)